MSCVALCRSAVPSVLQKGLAKPGKADDKDWLENHMAEHPLKQASGLTSCDAPID